MAALNEQVGGAQPAEQHQYLIPEENHYFLAHLMDFVQNTEIFYRASILTNTNNLK